MLKRSTKCRLMSHSAVRVSLPHPSPHPAIRSFSSHVVLPCAAFRLFGIAPYSSSSSTTTTTTAPSSSSAFRARLARHQRHNARSDSCAILGIQKVVVVFVLLYISIVRCWVEFMGTCHHCQSVTPPKYDCWGNLCIMYSIPSCLCT